jgi:hypothetical protein
MNALSKLRTMSLIVPGALCALGLTTPIAVRADDVNNAVNVNPTIWGDANPRNLIRLVAAVPAGQRRELVITYSAECAVESDDFFTSLDLDILVDGVVVPPTNSDNAFCLGTPPDNNAPNLDDWFTPSTTVVRAVGGGNHTVLVRGRITGFTAGERARIDDQSLVVVEEGPD